MPVKFSSLIKLGVLLSIIIALCQIALSQTSSKNQKAAPQAEQSERVEVEVEVEPEASWEWTKKPWTESDQPYKEIRIRIDKEVAQSKPADQEKLVERYKVKAQHSSSDPEAQFAWAYATWITRRETMTLGEAINRNYGPAEALKSTPFQANYEFVRLRFLFASWLYHPLRLRDLGDRLIQKEPNDFDVKRQLVEMYAMDDASADNDKKALAYARDLIRMQPDSPGVYSILASAYSYKWRKSGDVQAGRNAIINYQKYLQLAPASFPWRKQAQNLIETIEKELNKSK